MIDMKPNLWEYENKWRQVGKNIIAGTDEAGRGPLAGPVVAAAVVFGLDTEIIGLNDSKKLSHKKRDSLYNEIVEKCLYYSISTVDHNEIDEINILQASLLAMKKSVSNLQEKPDVVLIDGKFSFETDIDTETIVGGDGLSFSIAGASILAKVTRDMIMVDYDEMYPQYGFAKHKGYPTKLHYEAIRKHGACPIHRRSFRLF